jgi:hypothetical protein
MQTRERDVSVWRFQPITAPTSHAGGIGHRSGNLRRAEAQNNFHLPSLKNICIFKQPFVGIVS